MPIVFGEIKLSFWVTKRPAIFGKAIAARKSGNSISFPRIFYSLKVELSPFILAFKNNPLNCTKRAFVKFFLLV